MDVLFATMRRRSFSPMIVRNERALWKLYLVDAQYGSLGYDGYYRWSMAEGRYTLPVLFEFTALLDDVARRATPLLDLGYARVIECVDPAVAALISGDLALRCCAPGGEAALPGADRVRARFPYGTAQARLHRPRGRSS